MSLIAAAAVVLVPVQITSPELEVDSTFVSREARAQIASESVEAIKCLEIGERRDGTDRVCLASAEWKAVFEKARHNASVDRRERAIALAQYNASRPELR